METWADLLRSSRRLEIRRMEMQMDAMLSASALAGSDVREEVLQYWMQRLNLQSQEPETGWQALLMQLQQSQ